MINWISNLQIDFYLMNIKNKQSFESIVFLLNRILLQNNWDSVQHGAEKRLSLCLGVDP